MARQSNKLIPRDGYRELDARGELNKRNNWEGLDAKHNRKQKELYKIMEKERRWRSRQEMI